jgi:hypothetical protein
MAPSFDPSKTGFTPVHCQKNLVLWSEKKPQGRLALQLFQIRMERVKGIEPSYEAWEAAVLPLNYTRSGVVPRS